MAHNPTMRLNSFRVAILAASVVLAFSGSIVCHASCGGYVYSRFHTPAQHGLSVNQPAEVDEQDVTNPEILHSQHSGLGLSDSTPTQPTPCYGPNCSQNPTPRVPFAPLTTVGGSNQERLIFDHLTIELASKVSHCDDLHCDARTRRGFPLQIEMPPETVG